LLITNGLRFCIYKYWLMAKDFQARIYKWVDWQNGVADGWNTPPWGIPDDLLITKVLRFCIYKNMLMAKGLRGRIYRPECRVAPSCPNKLGRGTRETVVRAIDSFKIIPPGKQSQTEGRAAVCFCFHYIAAVKLRTRRTPPMTMKLS
jgi:hypothetical protein